MANVQLLNNVDHATLALDTGYAAEFGDSVNQCLVFPTEFGLLQREYVILIQKNPNGQFQPIILLGLDRNENLFLDDRRWNARYVPAMHQRGPFMIGLRETEIGGKIEREPMIHIDVDHPRVTSDGGVPIFLPHGGNSAYLEHSMAVLQIIHEGSEMLAPMFSVLQALDLLEQTAIRLSLSETEHYELADYYTINQQRFAQLDGDALAQLHHSGFLGAVFSIISSLSNAAWLVEMKISRQAGV